MTEHHEHLAYFHSTSDGTFKRACVAYLGARTLAPSSASAVKLLARELGHLSFAQITKSLDRLAKQRSWAGNSRARYLKLVKSVWMFAHETGITRTPCSIRVPVAHDGRLEYYDSDACTRLIDTAKASRWSWLLPYLVLAINTGGRPHEIVSATFDDIVYGQIGYASRKGKSKRLRRRMVPLNSDVLTMLDELPHKTGHIVRTRRGRAIPVPAHEDRTGSPTSALVYPWKQIKALAGVNDYRLYALRHTFATRLRHAGVDLDVIGKLLGHETLESTMIYAHIHPSTTSEVVERLSLDNKP